MRRHVEVEHLDVDLQLLLQIEAIKRAPIAAQPRLRHEFAAVAPHSERFVRRGLLDVGLEPKRCRHREPAEPDVAQIPAFAELHEQQHVGSRTHLVGTLP